jgi:hypothetical protein
LRKETLMPSEDVQDFLADAGAGVLGAQAQASTPDPMQIMVDPEIAKARRRLQLLEELKALSPPEINGAPQVVDGIEYPAPRAAPQYQPSQQMVTPVSMHSVTAAPTVTHDSITHAIGPPTVMEPVPQAPVPVPRVTVPLPPPIPLKETLVDDVNLEVPVPPLMGQPASEADGAIEAVLPPPKPPTTRPVPVPDVAKPLAELTPDIERMIRDVTKQLAIRNWLRVWKTKNAEGGWPGTNGYPSGLWLRVQARAKALVDARFIETWVRFLYANRSKVWSVSKVTHFVGFQATNFALLAEVEVAYGTKQRAVAGE